MGRVSAYEDYNSPVCWADLDADEMAQSVEQGWLCSQCGAEFCKPHHHKVACPYCFARLTEAEVKAEGVRLATYEERNRAAHINQARKRKARKNV